MAYPGAPSDRGFLVPFVPAGVVSPNEIPETVILQKENLEANILKKDFAACGIPDTMAVTLQSLVHALKYSKLDYDDDALRRTYAGARALGDSVTTSTFISVYMKRKRELSKLCETAAKELDIATRLLFQSEANLRRLSASERTSTGLEESKLTVQIVSVQNLQSNFEEGTAFKVNLECQGQMIETRPQVYHKGSIFWNEMFSFQIQSKEEEMKITLIRVDFEEEALGKCSVHLESLADQRKHESAKDIWGDVSCQILISSQWVYNKKSLYQAYVREYSARRELKKPFKSTRKSGGSGGFLAACSSQTALASAIDSVMTTANLTSYQTASQYFVVISLVLCCIACYARPLFFDLTIMGFAFWCNLDPRRWSVTRYTVLLVALAISFIMDFIWMTSFFSSWVGGTVEADLHNIARVFSIFNFFWKVIISLFFWKCRYDLSKRQGGLINVNKSPRKGDFS
eukprot:GHVP01030983.1.p1 GENE.GHVP01030983.1~~GHVP01030983.1.p1  ORF type:complete len:458 (+),score=68.27 GHVP01030983.1:35-1408(+)